LTLFDIAESNGQDLNVFARHLWEYTTGNHSDKFADHAAAYTKYTAVWDEREKASNVTCWKLSYKEQTTVHRRSISSKEMKGWIDGRKAHLTHSPLTNAPLGEEERLCHDHSHIDGELRDVLPEKENLLVGCGEAAAAYIAHQTYPGDDPAIFVPLFRTIFRCMIDRARDIVKQAGSSEPHCTQPRHSVPRSPSRI
jgi:hypothetical protein